MKSIRIARNLSLQNSIYTYTKSFSTSSNNISIKSRISSLSNDFIDDFWPITKINTGFNVCPEGFKMVIERLGKFDRVSDNGLVLAIPLIETISYVVNIKENILIINNEKATTKDNISVMLSLCVYYQFADVKKVVYGTINPFTSIRNHTKSAIKAVVSEIELKKLLESKSELDDIIKGTIEIITKDWGIQVNRCELQDLVIENNVSELLDKHTIAERELLHKLSEAEIHKKLALISIEAEKLRLENESESMSKKLLNEAEAKKKIILIESEAEAEALQIKVKAQAKAIEELSQYFTNESSAQAAKFVLASEFVKVNRKDNKVNDMNEIDNIIKLVSSTLSSNNKNDK